MVQRTVLKVDISCQKCKKKVLKAVSGLQGVDKIEVDEAKGTVTVTGNADPYEIIVKTRKTGIHAEVVSVGPPPAPPKPDAQKKPEDKKPDEKNKPEEKKKPGEKAPFVHDPYNCYECQRIVVMPMSRYDDPQPNCTIM